MKKETKEALREYKDYNKSLMWVSIGYFYSVFCIIWGIVDYGFMIFVGICLFIVTIFHHKWHRKRFGEPIKKWRKEVKK